MKVQRGFTNENNKI